MLLSLLLGCTTPCESSHAHGDVETVVSGGLSWQRTAFTDGICGPAFGTLADFDGDGSTEVAVTNFGRSDGFGISSGSVVLVDPVSATFETMLPAEAGYKWPNDASPVDIDGDGDLDVLIGLGFLTCQISPWTAPCGGILWLENDGDWTPREVVPPGADLFYHHPLLTDIDQDGVDDMVAVGESYAGPFGTENHAEVRWWAGLGEGAFASEHRVIGEGLGSIPQLWDVDGDGDDDLVSGEYFSADAASYVWMERDGTDWTRHIIDDGSGPSIQGEMVAGLLGDGVDRLVGSNHTNTAAGDPWPSEIAIYTPGERLDEPWDKQTLYDGFISEPGPGAAAPGIFSAGDIDSDGDIDLLVSGDGDPRVVWMEQTAPGEFSTHTLEEQLTQAGITIIEDLDGDGHNELMVSGYDDNVVFYYDLEVE